MNSEREYKYDVFISYRSSDKKWVRGELLRQLEACGLKVCIDYRDFEFGVPAIQNMESAVLNRGIRIFAQGFKNQAIQLFCIALN